MRKILLLLLPFFLWTCGGGGGSTEPEPPQLPTVSNIEVTTLEDTAKTFALTGTDPNNLALTYSISTQPQHGTISISGGAATYSPNANYHGQDVIAYLASSTNGNSNIGTIIITITPVDDEPNTMDVTATTDEDNSLQITLEAEEYDGENIEFQVRNNPSNGSVTISGTTATYIPNQDWYGTDQFNFEAVDSSNRSVLNVATATITVNPINDAPTVDDINDLEIQVGVDFNITLNAFDVENDNLNFIIVDNPSKGTVSINGNIATVRGNALGLDSFTYKANDGTDDSNVATVNMRLMFERVYGENSYSEEGYYVQETSDGGFIIFGTKTHTTGNSDLLLIKTDSLGNEEWSNSYGGNNNEGAYNTSLVITSDGGFLFGGYTSSGDDDMYLVKTDLSGNLEWSKTYGTNKNDRINSIIEDANGNFIIAGLSDQNSLVCYGYILKLDSSGNIITERKIGDISFNNEIRGLIQNNNGQYVVSKRKWDGNTQPNTELLILDSNFNTIKTSETIELFTSGNNGITEAHDTGYIIVGTGQAMDNDGDIQIIKVDSELDLNNGWETYFGSSLDYGYSVNKSSDGGYIIASVSDGDFYQHTNNSTGPYMDIILLKIDSSGNRVWSRAFGWDDDADLASFSYELSNGNIAIVGHTAHFSSPSDGAWDIFLALVDSDGNRISQNN